MSEVVSETKEAKMSLDTDEVKVSTNSPAIPAVFDPEVFKHQLFTRNHEMLQAQAQILQNNLEALKACIQLVLDSRDQNPDPVEDQRIVTAASNAISVLNYGAAVGAIPFLFQSIYDWSRIRIPQANLNRAQLIGCNFDDADLTRSSLIQAILHGSSFRRADLTDVRADQVLVLKGHAEKITSICYSPDSRYIASASKDSTVRIWDCSTGECVHTLKGHEGEVTYACYSPDGRFLVSSAYDRKLRFWDASSGKCLKILDCGDSYIKIRYSPDGSTIACMPSFKPIVIRDAITGEIKCKLRLKRLGIDVAFMPDGRSLISVGNNHMQGDSVLEVWDVATGESQILSLERPLVEVSITKLSADGQWCVAHYRNAVTRIWNLATRQCTASLSFGDVRSLTACFSADGCYLAVGAHDMSCRVFDLATGKSVREFIGHSGDITSVQISPDGRFIASGSDDNTLRIWNNITEADCLPKRAAHSSSVASGCFSPDNRLMVSGSSDSSLRVWDTTTGQCTAVLQGHTSGITCVCFHPDGQHVISSSYDHKIKIWDVATGQCARTLEAPDTVAAIAISPNSQELISGSGTVIQIWDLSTGECKATLNDHTDRISTLAYNHDGTLFASGSNSRTIRIWDAASHQCKQELNTGTILAQDISFTPNSRRIVVSAFSRELKVWDLAMGKFVGAYTCDDVFMKSMAHSFDGRWIAAGCTGGLVHLWDTATFARRVTLSGHASREVKSVCISNDASLLASCSADRTVRIYNMSTAGASHTATLKCVLGDAYALDLDANFEDAKMSPQFRKLVQALRDGSLPQEKGGCCTIA